MDADAFERIVMAEKDRIHGYATLMLRDRAEAQDVAQEALVRLWAHREAVDERGARAWLLRTAHHLCIDRTRRRRVRREVGSEVLEGLDDAGRPGPGELAAAGEVGRAIEQVLAELTPADREVLILREVQGLPYETIAATLEVPIGTLKARLHRARDRARARLVRAGVVP